MAAEYRIGPTMWRTLPLALALAFASAVHAQGAQGESRCYQFDQPYFGQVRHDDGTLPGLDTTAFGRHLAGLRAARATGREIWEPHLNYLTDSVRFESTAIVRLEAGPSDTATGGTAVSPMPGADWPRAVSRRRLVAVFKLPEVTRRDPEGGFLVRRFSPYWQPLTADSLAISWHTGYAGPVFRLATRGDSLIGTVVHLSDVIRTDSVTGRVVRPPQLPARAVRIACAPATGPA